MKLVDIDRINEELGGSDEEMSVREFLESQPVVDAAPIRYSYWSYDCEDGYNNYDWHCDACGGSIGYRCGEPVFSNYCLHCGAKMTNCSEV